MPLATIAVPTYQPDHGVFARMLELALAGSEDEEIVVVDMSPRDDLRALCEEAGPRVRYDHFPESGGVASSRNRCVELAATRYVCFLDSDAFPEPGWAAALVTRLQGGNAAVAGSKILPYWEGTPRRAMTTVPASDWLSLLDLGDEAIEVPRIIGTSYALDRERVREQPFDERLGRRPGWPLAMEENELCESAREAGWSVYYEPASVVRHHIPAERATWRTMWRRAHTAGRETRVAGRAEPMPGRRLGPRDRAFQAAVAVPFFAGALGQRRRRGD